MMLAAGRGSTVTIETIGADDAQALESIVALIDNKFGEAD